MFLNLTHAVVDALNRSTDGIDRLVVLGFRSFRGSFFGILFFQLINRLLFGFNRNFLCADGTVALTNEFQNVCYIGCERQLCVCGYCLRCVLSIVGKYIHRIANLEALLCGFYCTANILFSRCPVLDCPKHIVHTAPKQRKLAGLCR